MVDNSYDVMNGYECIWFDFMSYFMYAVPMDDNKWQEIITVH